MTILIVNPQVPPQVLSDVMSMGQRIAGVHVVNKIDGKSTENKVAALLENKIATIGDAILILDQIGTVKAPQPLDASTVQPVQSSSEPHDGGVTTQPKEG